MRVLILTVLLGLSGCASTGTVWTEPGATDAEKKEAEVEYTARAWRNLATTIHSY